MGSNLYTPEVIALPSTSQYVGQGRFFLSGSGKLTTSGGLLNARGVLVNPVGSGRTVYEARVVAFSTSTGFADIKITPTNLPTTPARGVLNAITSIQPAGNVANFYADVSSVPFTGGYDPGFDLAIPANQRITVDLPPLVAPPGAGLGVTLKLSNNADVEFSVYWWEA